MNPLPQGCQIKIFIKLLHLTLCMLMGQSSSASPSSYSHFYVGSMYDDIRLHVARSYTSSANSPIRVHNTADVSSVFIHFCSPSSQPTNFVKITSAGIRLTRMSRTTTKSTLGLSLYLTLRGSTRNTSRNGTYWS